MIRPIKYDPIRECYWWNGDTITFDMLLEKGYERGEAIELLLEAQNDAYDDAEFEVTFDGDEFHWRLRWKPGGEWFASDEAFVTRIKSQPMTNEVWTEIRNSRLLRAMCAYQRGEERRNER